MLLVAIPIGVLIGILLGLVGSGGSLLWCCVIKKMSPSG
jgi:hypothetical protein